mgnify:CR=1 FL=1
MEKTYNPQDIEQPLYEHWEKQGYFKPNGDESQESFCIMIPPPNVTGSLHMGHAFQQTIMDTMIRYQRMQGKNTLWQVGTDHAGIATQMVVERKIAAEEGKTRHDYGRDAFIDKIWQWKAESGGTITRQMRRLGNSVDWERERFTMDEGLSNAVKEVFVRLYKEDLIYRGKRLVNWDPKLRTAISDLEVENRESKGSMWHIRYPLADGAKTADGKDYLVVATTRPETLLGDTGVAVNPEDPRYKDLIGKYVILPLVNRRIPIVGDEHADMEKGTGCVKITPAHDFNDYEVGRRHQLPMINILTFDGDIRESAEVYDTKGNESDVYSSEIPAEFQKLERFAARKAVVAAVDALGLLEEIKPHDLTVPYGDRGGVVIEPMLTDQWYVRADVLAKPAVEAVENGDIQFVPKQYENMYFSWMRDIQDWCISRQLWWGHRIPAFYCDDCGEMTVSKTDVHTCPKCGSKNIRQEEDVLDTWFSSALWPFSTLGWPDNTEELKYFYPTNTLVTGYDIIFFWVARMIFSGLEHMGEVPFNTVFFHGLIRDAQGRKMSKSLGNGVDPLDVISVYGADALRFTLVTGNSPGNDLRFSEEKVSASRNFANKIWNAARFILMNIEGKDIDCALPKKLYTSDKWILNRFNNVTAAVTENLEKFELGMAVSKLYDFIWDDFCDWYIELAKIRMNGADEESADSARRVLVWTMSNTLKLLHPFMPYITEEIWQTLPHDGEALIVAKWPEYDEALSFPQEAKNLENVMALIRAIRTRRNEMNVPPSKKAHIYIDTAHPAPYEEASEFIARLAYGSKVEIGTGFDVQGAVTAVTDDAKALLPMDDLVDKAAETARLNKELANAQKQLDTVKAKLANEKFTSKAPQNVIDGVKANGEKLEAKIKLILETLESYQ